jgi:regulator of sigma D
MAMAIELAEDTPFFDVRGSTITHRNPKMITDGIMVCQEAYIEINTKSMSQTFIQLLMHHMGEGHIKVRMAEKKETT